MATLWRFESSPGHHGTFRIIPAIPRKAHSISDFLGFLVLFGSASSSLRPTNPRLFTLFSTPEIRQGYATGTSGAMATIRKRGKTWRAEIARHGIRMSSTFDTKAEAGAWATKIEAEIQNGKNGQIPAKPVRDLLDRYAKDVSATKRGNRWEVLRLNLLGRDPLADIHLPDLNASHIAAWRDRRLRGVSAASVRREWNLLHHAFNLAVFEWKWLAENPMKGVRQPAPPQPRDRRISQDEIDRLLFALGYAHEQTPATLTARVGAAMLFAIETAMRAGEITGPMWERVDLEKRFARLPQTKNGTARDVALSAEAVRILRQLGGSQSVGSVFGLQSTQIDALFRKAKGRAPMALP